MALAEEGCGVKHAVSERTVHEFMDEIYPVISMKSRVNMKTLRRLVPWWAVNQRNLAYEIDRMMKGVGSDVSSLESGWGMQCNHRDIGFELRIEERRDKEDPYARSFNGKFRIQCTNQIGSKSIIHIPLDALFKPTFEGKSYCVYVHRFPLSNVSYVGISCRPWFERLDEHIRSARRGSKLLFHQKIASDPDQLTHHRLLAYGISYDDAMNLEEDMVKELSLYPKGLNMIPGGFAGLQYLSRVGITAKNETERDAAVEDLVLRQTVNGRPNPLCAARWATDQDYINRVICGHGNRLSVGQVRDARLMLSYGNDVSDVSNTLSVPPRKIREINSGRHYARVM